MSTRRRSPEEAADLAVRRLLARRGIRPAYPDEDPWSTFAFALGSELIFESIRELVVDAVATDRAAARPPADAATP